MALAYSQQQEICALRLGTHTAVRPQMKQSFKWLICWSVFIIAHSMLYCNGLLLQKLLFFADSDCNSGQHAKDKNHKHNRPNQNCERNNLVFVFVCIITENRNANPGNHSSGNQVHEHKPQDSENHELTPLP
nr:MAG TPA: hypothetical protein [Bacteriophage sp.]